MKRNVFRFITGWIAILTLGAAISIAFAADEKKTEPAKADAPKAEATKPEPEKPEPKKEEPKKEEPKKEAPAKPAPPAPDKFAAELEGYRTVATALRAKAQPAVAPVTNVPVRTGYLGIFVEAKDGQLLIDEIAPDSPALAAGLKKGDQLATIDKQTFADNNRLRDWLQEQAPGQAISIAIKRGDKELVLTAALGATSSPMSLSRQRAIMGVRFTDAADIEGVRIDEATAGGPAQKAGIKSGDVIVKVNGSEIKNTASLRDFIAARSPGDQIKVLVRRAEEETEYSLHLAADSSSTSSRGPTSAMMSYWKKPTYRLAVIPVEYPDAKHNEKVTLEAWTQALFSRDTYKDKSITGQTVYGSVADYYHEMSGGKLALEGKVFDWVEVSKERAEYGKDVNNKSPLLIEAMEKLLERDGKDALNDFDGVYYMYAGDRFRTSRGGLYWPHRSSFSFKGKRWSYFIMPEGGRTMSNISTICHEFGHMLGLPDLYARPENPGSEGLSVWCAMSNQVTNGRPQHFSAWPKVMLGWVDPIVIDPTVKQKLVLSPIEDDSTQCFKILVRPDGSEYFLLENRRKKGFDESLPAEGLLIWRVVGNRPQLEESHGIEGPAGPLSYRDAVPYPSKANTAFTPFTTPSSRGQLGGGMPVHITNIRELPDGRITFWIGYEFQ
ncbi:MAG: M6 family metalloprotease domain-containing protein [Phycisphaeraceae bacterium]